jgi:alanine or glycine:cation symporter, AGCS family
MTRLIRFLALFALLFSASVARSEEVGKSMAERIDETIAPIAVMADKIVFFGLEVTDGVVLPIVLILLAFTAIFLTIYFRFINLRGFGIALRTARGKYTPKDAPGEITHFQALSAALSATVGLGNIGGVAVAVGIGGPGATFWMIVMGLCGMTTKFAECTLGVKYRKFMKNGTVKGGGMYYLSDGLREIGLGGLGKVLALIFAVFVIGGAFGAGNMFQANQAFSQMSNTFPVLNGASGNGAVYFGLAMAILTGLVILGGIVSIARVTSFLVPFMCGMYVIACLIIIFGNITALPGAFGTIISSAFSNDAVTGGIIGVLIQGVRRAAFSNEAGLGSAPIAHSAVKTNEPASEGFVALLEPFVDTVVVCTMSALVQSCGGRPDQSAGLDRARPKARTRAVSPYPKDGRRSRRGHRTRQRSLPGNRKNHRMGCQKRRDEQNRCAGDLARLCLRPFVVPRPTQPRRLPLCLFNDDLVVLLWTAGRDVSFQFPR